MTEKSTAIMTILLPIWLLAAIPCSSYQEDPEWATQQDSNQTDTQLDRADDTQWKTAHERESLIAAQDQLERTLDELQRADSELSRDIDQLTAKEREVASETTSVISSLNDVHRKLQEF